jgi:hypothetical protein
MKMSTSKVRKYEVNFEIDEEKAQTIGEILLDSFYSRKGFFKNTPMPEYVLPRNLKNGTKEHALYLTYVISIELYD